MSLDRVGLALLTSEMMSPGSMTPLIMLPLPSVMLVTCGERTQKSSDPCVALIGTTLTLQKEHPQPGAIWLSRTFWTRKGG